VVLLIPSLAWAVTRPDTKGAELARLAKTAKSVETAKANRRDKRKSEKKRKKVSRYAPVTLYQINTKETLRLRFYDDRGMPIRRWRKRFNRFMRCHNTGAVFRMDERLAKMLYQTGRHFEGHRLEIVSGYRHPKIAKNPKSPHKHGVACDFRVAGIKNTELRDYLRKTFKHAGVGYYPNSLFVHLDDRKKGASAFWIDFSGPGQAADYSENPQDDLRNGRTNHVRVVGDQAAGHAEGADDVAQAGAALAPRKGTKAGNRLVSKPVEIKAPSDTFGD
jgi:uncharacterized protein YcbK (DUF882 family)